MLFFTEDDLDLKLIAESGQCFRFPEVPGEPGTFRVLTRDRCLYIREEGPGTDPTPGKRFSLSCGEEEFRSVWAPYFDLSLDYRDVRGRIGPEEDPFLFRAAEFGKGIRILRQDPWEMLISFIISQNRNIPAIRNSIELLCRAAGEERTDARGLSYFTFPEPEAVLSLTEEELRGCKLGYRWRYVRAAAEACAEAAEEERLDLSGLLKAPETETLEALQQICGVGVKVANCVSLFGLHHLNAFPVDVWMKRILDNEYPFGYPFERYAPYNGIYQQYMFTYYRLGRSKDTGAAGEGI